MSQYQDDSWGTDSQARGNGGEFVSPYRYVRLKKGSRGTVLRGFQDGEFVVLAKGNKAEGALEIPKQIVIVEVALGMQLQSPYVEGKQRKTYCKSNDRILPVLNDTSINPKCPPVFDQKGQIVGGGCADCAFGNLAWKKYNDSGKNRDYLPKNPCERTAKIVFVDFNAPGLYYTYTVDRFDANRVENLKLKLQEARDEAAKTLGRTPSIFEFVINLDSGYDKNNIVPIFEVAGVMPQEFVEEFREVYNTHKQNRARWESKQGAAAVQNAAQDQHIDNQPQHSGGYADPTANLSDYSNEQMNQAAQYVEQQERVQEQPVRRVVQQNGGVQQLQSRTFAPNEIQQTYSVRPDQVQPGTIVRNAASPVTRQQVQTTQPVQNSGFQPPARRTVQQRPVYTQPVDEALEP